MTNYDVRVEAGRLIEIAERTGRTSVTFEPVEEPPTLSLWADGATPEQREAIFTAAVDAAFDASEGMDGVSVGAVGALS